MRAARFAGALRRRWHLWPHRGASRPAAPFAKLVDVFNAHNVSFDSVDQRFNTASSISRLTLNMPLAFAQFEREVTGERIRDRIAASNARVCGWAATRPWATTFKTASWSSTRPRLSRSSGCSAFHRARIGAAAAGSACGQRHHLEAAAEHHRLLSGNRSLQRGNSTTCCRTGYIGVRWPKLRRRAQAILDEALWDKLQDRLISRRSDNLLIVVNLGMMRQIRVWCSRLWVGWLGREDSEPSRRAGSKLLFSLRLGSASDPVSTTFVHHLAVPGPCAGSLVTRQASSSPPRGLSKASPDYCVRRAPMNGHLHFGTRPRGWSYAVSPRALAGLRLATCSMRMRNHAGPEGRALLENSPTPPSCAR